MIVPINPEIIPYDNLIRALCLTPYHGHFRGCPNYNKKDGCPPTMLLDNIIDFSKDMYVIYTKFEIGRFAERMRLQHPEWKESTYPDQPKKAVEFRDNIINRLMKRHLDWPDEYFPRRVSGEWVSSREWYNPRRWQESSRKGHKDEIENFTNQHPGLYIDSFPEAHGVNLTGLMYEVGIKLSWQWPPPHDILNESYSISIAGHIRL